jgi:oxygen-independent coproporphyrinogen III oxidase
MSLGIYIQVPFCQTKCTYCNFHTGPAARSLYAPYARAVAEEIAAHNFLYSAADLREALSAAEQTVDTVYIGGGTPSLLDPADLASILDAVREHFRCELSEVTLEADPETIRADNAAAWKTAGVNRISLGAQSFHDRELIAAGRMHRAADIPRAMELLRTAGLCNLSLDLIAGLPHQTAESWSQSLDELLRLRPEHISIYLLEIDEGSSLGRESLAGGARYSAAAIPDDDAMASSYELACQRLAAEGYDHYEISNWALPGRHSQHNLKYWRREPYLGFGAGAHSLSFAAHPAGDASSQSPAAKSGACRWANGHDPAAYVASIQQGRLPVEQREDVTRQQALEEELFLGLRELAGIDLARVERQYDVDLGARITELCAQGLVERDGPRVRLAPARLAVSNEVFVALLD